MIKTKFHFIKMETPEDAWLTYFNPSPARLQRLIARHSPKNIYLSVNQYLRFKEHPNFPNLMLKRYGLVDIDGQNFENKEECKKYYIELNQFLEEQNISIGERVCTNNTVGGYQIVILPCCYRKFCNLIQSHPQRFSKVDTRVFDEKRVRRMPQSFNGNRGCFSYYIDEFGNPKDLNSNSHKDNNGITGTIQQTEVHSTGMPLQADDKGAVITQHISPCKTKQEEANGSKLPLHFIVRQVSNSIQGAKDLYIPCIKLKYNPSPRRIKRLQKIYSIGDLYVFRYHNGYMLIGLKTFSSRRLQKIYQAFKSYSSYNELIKFKQNWCYTSNIVDLDNKQFVDSFEFLKLCEYLSNGWYSATHLPWLSHYSHKDYPAVIGNPAKIMLAEFRRD